MSEHDKTEHGPSSAESVRNIGSQGLVSREEYVREYEQVMGTRAPQSIREHIAISQGTPEPGNVPPYVFCGYGTAAQAQAFSVWCDQHGVERRIVTPTGGAAYKLTRR